MANQTGVLRGIIANGVKAGQPADLVVLVTDTTATAVQFVNRGSATAVTYPGDVVFTDFSLPANTATVVRIIPQVDGDNKTSKTLLTAFLSDPTGSVATRFGQPFTLPRGSIFSMTTV